MATRILGIRIDPKMLKQLQEKAEKDDRTVSDYVRLLIKKDLKESGKNDK